MKNGRESLCWLPLLVGLACGGNTTDVPAGKGGSSTSGASTAGDSSNGNVGATSGSSGSAGGSDTPSSGGSASEPPICVENQPACIASCASLDFTVADCVESHYRCPAGSVDLDTCPPDACAKRTRNCCSPSGVSTIPECAADGSIGACPKGFQKQETTCLPQGAQIHDCSEIMIGDVCPTDGLVCYTGRCTRNCDCMADDSGALHWQCSALPC